LGGNESRQSIERLRMRWASSAFRGGSGTTFSGKYLAERSRQYDVQRLGGVAM